MRTRTVPHARLAPLALALLFLLSPLLALAGDDYERWYTVEMSGKRCGYMHSVQSTSGDRITSSSTMVISMGRGDSSVAMTMEGQFVETAAGKPVSMRMVQKLGTAPKTVDYTFGEKEISITTVEGDQRRTTTKPNPEGAWLTPAAATDYLRQRFAANAEKITVRTVDPLSGPDPETLTLTGIDRTMVEVRGKAIPAIKCTSSASSAPGVSMTEYMDEQGIPIRSQVGMGPIAITVVVSDKTTATAKGAEAPEMMVTTLVKPDRPIKRPRDAKRSAFILSIPDGKMPALPITGIQRSEAVDERTARVEVGGEPVPAPEADSKDASYLASTSMLRADDPEIKRLLAEATKAAKPGKPARAEAMRAFVEKYITTKDLDVGFASASEVARTRRGDCTEHAALLAALLRADGIPSRVVSGLVYVDSFEGEKGIFGYHMWAEALLEKDGHPTWVDLDGTLPKRPFDATHIALATTALGEGEEATSLAAILPLLGRLQIKVESVE
jgi:transglutaminase-like putative cysteine protease